MREKTKSSGFWGLLIAAGLVLFVGTASAELVAKLPQVQNPFFLTIADGRMYIVENSVSAHIYTLGPKGAVFVKTFGRKGQGPGEFDFMYRIRVFEDFLDISGSQKLARFSRDGEYLDEVKVPIGMFKGGIFRLGANYLAGDVQFDAREATRTIRLYDNHFKLIREIGAHREPMGYEKINLVPDGFSFRVVENQIFVVAAAKESIVTVYDRNGVRHKEIRLPLELIRMTASLKEALLKPLREDPEYRKDWAKFEKRLFFPDQTPGLDFFDAVEARFVARTYKYRQDKVEFVVCNQSGKELRRLDLPFTGRLSNGILFCFHQGRYYYLRENVEEEVWELHYEKVW